MNLNEEEARRIAHAIANGHAYWKHAANLAESVELISESSFEWLILQTILTSAKRRDLTDGRWAFWNDEEGLMVLDNPADPDLGTAFWPGNGIDRFKKIR